MYKCRFYRGFTNVTPNQQRSAAHPAPIYQVVPVDASPKAWEAARYFLHLGWQIGLTSNDGLGWDPYGDFFGYRCPLKQWWWIIEHEFFIPQVWDSISDIKLIRSKKTPFIRRRSCFFFSGGWSSWIWQHKCHVAALKLTWVSKTYHCYKASLASSYIQLTKFWSLEIFIDFPISPNLTNELLMKGQQK